MPFFWSKKKTIVEMIDDYMESLDKCMVTFSEGLKTYIKSGCTDEFKKKQKETHTYESLADDIRREIELKLYGKALLPESRGDVLGMLESVDKIASAAEDVLAMLSIEKPAIPEELAGKYKKLVDLNMEAYFLIHKAVDANNHNPRETLYIDKEIDQKASESDRLEEKMLELLFGLDLPLAEKQQQKIIIKHIGSISDRCQNSVDRLSIIAIKRRI